MAAFRGTLGELAGTLIDKDYSFGEYIYEWDGGKFASGIYILRFEAGDYLMTRKTILLK